MLMTDITKSTSCVFRKSKTSCPFLQLAATLIYSLVISDVIPSKKTGWSSVIIMLIVSLLSKLCFSNFIFINASIFSAFVILMINYHIERAYNLSLS
tara:strand:- start:35 stop:325 length:291 start_codon:yes stop_codon:yes gene_type:complete